MLEEFDDDAFMEPTSSVCEESNSKAASNAAWRGAPGELGPFKRCLRHVEEELAEPLELLGREVRAEDLAEPARILHRHRDRERAGGRESHEAGDVHARQRVRRRDRGGLHVDAGQAAGGEGGGNGVVRRWHDGRTPTPPLPQKGVRQRSRRQEDGSEATDHYSGREEMTTAVTL